MTASAGIAGWLEFALLRRTLNRRIGSSGLSPVLLGKLWGSAAVAAAAAWAVKPAAAAAAAWAVKLGIGPRGPFLPAAAILGVYGLVYFAAAYALRIEECVSIFRRLRRS